MPVELNLINGNATEPIVPGQANVIFGVPNSRTQQAISRLKRDPRRKESTIS